MNDLVVWSLIGIILLAIECFIMPSMGIIFTGFAAICVAGTIYHSPEIMMGAIGTQLFYFFIFTGLWGGILWMPMRHFLGYAAEDLYKNVIGSFGTLHEALKKNEIGLLNWSGSLVKAKIDPQSSADELKAKSYVRITAIEDGVYIVRAVREDIEGLKDRETILREQEERKAQALAQYVNDTENPFHSMK